MFFSLWVVQCIGAGYKSNIYVENSVYATAATQKKPWEIARLVAVIKTTISH